MSTATRRPSSTVQSEEVEKRIAEYRRLAFQRQAPPQVVYEGWNIFCPWAGCNARIAGINFQLDRMGDALITAQRLAAWWNGPGLIGRCPSCKRYVLFEVTGKRAVADPMAIVGASLLPDDWHLKAHLVMRPVQ